MATRATDLDLDLELIPATATCTFVGEGRANLVFALSLPAPDDNNHPNLRGQLLRLPKAHTTSKSKALPYPLLQTYWRTRIAPLFPSTDLVQQRLVRLPAGPAFAQRLNAQLHDLDASGTRRGDFVGHGVDSEGELEVGMLVEDMRIAGGDGVRMHEIKPKWLHQSPRAPPGADQCRNCAREVWRNRKDATRKPIFCPLNLVKAADFKGEAGVVEGIAAELRRCFGDKAGGGMSEAEAWNVARWLGDSKLFLRLRRIQWENDHAADVDGGDGGGNDEAYSLAMTLRDCSLFVLVPVAPGAEPGEVVAKLGDTDMKNFAVKKEYWVRMEREFHESGVYWNTEPLSLSLTACQLPFYRERMALGGEVREELGRFYMV